MQLTQYTDYALRVLLYAGEREAQLVTIAEIAEFYKISRNHLMKVASQLTSLGYLEALRGRNGGLRLARKPEEIMLGEVVRQLEPNFNLAECFTPREPNCILSNHCKLKSALNKALQEFIRSLDKTTLASVLQNRG